MVLLCLPYWIFVDYTHAKRTTMYPLPVQDAFARWHMDILAGLPKTKDGYQYILLLIGFAWFYYVFHIGFSWTIFLCGLT
jgi:hypothetical protein